MISVAQKRITFELDLDLPFHKDEQEEMLRFPKNTFSLDRVPFLYGWRKNMMVLPSAVSNILNFIPHYQGFYS